MVMGRASVILWLLSFYCRKCTLSGSTSLMPRTTCTPHTPPPSPSLTDLSPQHRDAWFHLGYALKEQGQVREGESALLQSVILDKEGKTHHVAWRLIAHAKQGLGNHSGAVKAASDAIRRGMEGVKSGVIKREALAELYMLRGACHHALGQFRSAVEDYATVWKMDGGAMGGETAQLR